MKKLISTIPVFLLIVFCAWIVPKEDQIKKAEWLQGTWENKTARGSVYESWTKGKAKELLGKSYVLNGEDTMLLETIRIAQEDNRLIYSPIVRNQNDGQAVHFKSKLISKDKLVFENPAHDFPQFITYTKIGADSLVAEISGEKNGQKRKQVFPMKRIK